jgi:hypothetical protein
MKKSVFVVLASLIIISFKVPHASMITRQTSPKNIVATLNGFTYAQANDSVTYCVSTKDNTPKNTQVWFRREIVEAWYKLLKADIAWGTTPDGIRIYISRPQATSQNPIHYNNRIVVVSTFSKDTVINNEKITMHKDYYNHADTDALFKLTSINGKASHDKNANNGALLFNTCHCDTKLCDPSNHAILRSEAEKMVHHFHSIPIFRNGSINSRAEWFELSVIKTLVDDMKIGNDDGIRIYFARGVVHDYTQRKAKFIIVTTKHDSSNTIQVDDFDCNHPAFMMPTLYSDGQDNGELCPTNCYGLTLPSN